MLGSTRLLLAEPAGMFNRGIPGAGAHIPFPHLKAIVTSQDDDDGGAFFYPSDFPPTPAGVCTSPVALDESFGVEDYFSRTDENQMEQEPAAQDAGNYGGDLVPMLSTSMVTSANTEPELLQSMPVLLGPSRRSSLPSSHSSTSLVTQANDHDRCNENDITPNIGSSCGCGDPQCIEGSSFDALSMSSVSTSFPGSRSMTIFSMQQQSRAQTAAHSGGTSQSEIFSTITASQSGHSNFDETATIPGAGHGEEACTRQGLECEFAMEPEEAQASMQDESRAIADYYQQELFPAPSTRPVSPLISRMLGDNAIIDPAKLPSTATQIADGPGFWYSSGGGRPPARNTLRLRRNSADKLYAYDRRARYGVLCCKSAESMKQEAEPSRSKESAIPDFLRSKPVAKCGRSPSLRHSRSEPALLRGSRWAPSYQDSVKNLPRPGYGGGYPSGMIPTSSILLPSRSQSSVELPSCSASSQVRAQIQTYTQSKACHREENPSRLHQLDPRSLHLPSSSGLSASALISRAAAGMNIPGSSSDSSSIGMGFSKLATAAAASGNLHNTQPQQQQQQHQVDGGLRLVQILVNCAEAVACRDSRQASSLLRTLQGLASPYGDAMQRVAACFLDGLSTRIDNSPAGFKSSGNNAAMAAVVPARVRASPSERERHEGFSLLCQSCPYVGFGHYSANTAMLEAFAGEDALHVIDLGMSHGLQWPGLIRSLASRAGGKPRSLRITGVGLNAAKMAEAGEQLDRVAREVDLTFAFRIVNKNMENLDRSMLDLRDGEALAVNSVLQLHCVVKESRGSLNAVLQSIHDLRPKILTLVEQDASHNGPFFMGRFVEALHYYSAIFDSLDATLPRYSTQRVKIEQFHYGEEIRNIVSCEGPSRVERHERIDQWRRRMSRAGFQPQPLKFLHDTRRWLASYDCPGYTLAEEKGCLVLGWNSKPIIAASSWRC